MSLSKQLYIIITFIFFLVFTGNFIISIKNTKDYLEIESLTKAQDTATSLGMTLKNLIKDKSDPEIETIIKAISNRGFYKEIRLEDSEFIINENSLLHLVQDDSFTIENISVAHKFGTIEKVDDSDINKQLQRLENEDFETIFNSSRLENKYRFIPSKNYENGGEIEIKLKLIKNDKIVDKTVLLDIQKIIIKESRDVKFDSTPSWFVDIISFNLEEQFSEISDGWNISAIIYVSPNPAEAYSKLYEQAKNSIIYSLIAFLISMIILFAFVQYILKPLKTIEKLAKSIAKGKFSTIDKLPLTTEIKHVSIAMNEMSIKIEAIINKLNKNIENASKKLSYDSLTNLPLKPTFETDIKGMFIQKSNGYILRIKISVLTDFAKTHTTDEVNTLIKEFSKILKSTKSINNKDIKLNSYRFFGSLFMIILKDCNHDEAKKVCEAIKLDLDQLASKYGLTELAYIGGTPFNKYGTTFEILEGTKEAYEKAKLIGPNEFFLRTDNDLVRDMAQWRNLIFDIIDNKKFDVEYINNTYSLKDKNKLLLQEAFTSAKDEDGKIIPIGTFVSIAEKYDKAVDFDKAVISKVIDFIVINNIKNNIMINLSLQTISDKKFLIWLKKTIEKNKTIASRLSFSLTAYTVAKDVESFKIFSDEVHALKAKIIIKRYESKFILLSNLKDFNLDYIRLARNYTTGISTDISKQSFVESLQELASLLNIEVYCESVKDDEDFKYIKKLNLSGASRE